MTDKSTKTILVVDDEADVLTFIRTLLEDNGFAVICAENGKEGFSQAKARRPDLILLDISMPEESGVRMYRNLRGDPQTATIPVVMLTGVSHDFKKFIETRRQVPPPEGYFDKPPDREQLLAKINELIGARTLVS
ncbi:MAG: response regulator [Candidatus Korobacteraceae bacterium]|jgi:CheY-like chemotaxis protein